MAESTPQLITRDFRAGDQSAIARIKLDAIAHGELPGEDAAGVARWAESLTVDPSGTVVAEFDGHVIGFLGPNEHQVVVDRDHRRRGAATALVEYAEPQSSLLLLWLPEDNIGAQGLFDALRYAYFASLWEMTLPAGSTPPEPVFPEGMRFTDWESADLSEFVRVFNTAFAEHPTPLQITRELVEWSKAQPGNEKFEYLLVRDSAGALIGFARGRLNKSDEGDSGEVDFIGLLPEWRGRGLGRALLLWTIGDLRRRGAGPVILHVEAQNQNALTLYESAGFAPSHEWRRFARHAS